MSAWDDRTDDDAYEAREEALGERLADAEFNRARQAPPSPNAEAIELLRCHVMDWGNCDRPDCDCSHARARRWLRERGIHV